MKRGPVGLETIVDIDWLVVLFTVKEVEETALIVAADRLQEFLVHFLQFFPLIVPY